MKIIDERKNNSSRFDELPIGVFFHELADDTDENAPLYIKLSENTFATRENDLFNAWSINNDMFCMFEDYERVVKLNVEITIKN